MINKTTIALTTSVLSFLFIFNLFYTVAPYPIQIASLEDVQKFAPKGYVHPADQPDKIVVWFDTWKGYKVIEYWYHWNYDGHEIKDDWEPVILLIDGNVTKAVAVRMHYMWRVAYTFPEEDGKLVVSFATLWHTPYLKYPNPDWSEVKVNPVLSQPPEDIDYTKVFGLGFSPTESALASALIFGFIGAVFAFFLVRMVLIFRCC